jgi:CHAT domain-containing protein/tetratricopeptide (TPR) repeat protein
MKDPHTKAPPPSPLDEALSEFVSARSLPKKRALMDKFPILQSIEAEERLSQTAKVASAVGLQGSEFSQLVELLRGFRFERLIEKVRESHGSILSQAISDLLNSPDLETMQTTIADNPSLLTEEAERSIQNISIALLGSGRSVVAHKLRFIRRCREIGLDQALREERQDDSRIERRNEIDRLLKSQVNATTAQPLLKEYLALLDPVADESLRARTQAQLGLLLGQRPSTNEEFEEGLRILRNSIASETLLGPKTIAIICGVIAGALLSRAKGSRSANLELALQVSGDALAKVSRETDSQLWAMLVNVRAGLLTERLEGDRGRNVEDAIDLLRQIDLKTHDQVQVAETAQNLGLAFLERRFGDRANNLDEAIKCFKLSLRKIPRAKMRSEWAETASSLGNAYADRINGRHSINIEKAIRAYESALEEGGDSSGLLRSTVEGNLALAYLDRRQGDRQANVEQAIRLASRSLGHVSKELNTKDWAASTSVLANAYMHRTAGNRSANLSEAIELHMAAAAIISRHEAPSEWSSSCHNLGFAYELRGDSDLLAIESYKNALLVRTLYAMPAEHAQTSLQLGRVLFKQQQWSAASTALLSALEAYEMLYRSALVPMSRNALLRKTKDVSSMAAYSLAKIDDLGGAVSTLERWRARSLSEVLGLSRAESVSVPPANAEQFDLARQAVKHLQAQVRWATTQEVAALASEIETAYHRLNEIITSIRRYNPGFLLESGLDQALKAAKSAPILFLLATSHGGLALIVTSDVRAVWLPEAELEEIHDRVGSLFAAYAEWRKDPRNRRRMADWKTSLDALSEWMWDKIMGKALSAVVEGPVVVLVPIGTLGYLPLHVSCQRDDGTRIYALDRVQIRYAPNALSIVQGEAKSKGSARSFLGVADPIPSEKPTLPQGKLEVEIAARGFDSHLLLIGRAAVRSEVLKKLKSYSWVHICCHGVGDPTNPSRAGLFLASDELLTIKDVAPLDLTHLRLAVLSACETAVSGSEIPDEVVGLPTEFLRLGSSGVIATQWIIPDEQSLLLVSYMYDLISDGMQPADALHEAQRWLRNADIKQLAHFLEKQPRLSGLKHSLLKRTSSVPFRHPVYWAAFCYFGV